jgi:hypothetical protein
VEWIHLARDRDRWRDVVNTVMNLQLLEPQSLLIHLPSKTNGTLYYKPFKRLKLPYGYMPCLEGLTKTIKDNRPDNRNIMYVAKFVNGLTMQNCSLYKNIHQCACKC